MQLKKIAELVKGELIGNENLEISNCANLEDASISDISFIFDKKSHPKALKSKAQSFITHQKIDGLQNQIICQNPKEALAKIITLFNPPPKQKWDTPPIKGTNAHIDQTVTTGPHVIIGNDTKVNAHTQIHPNVTIGNNCTIGKNCLIYSNVSILDHTQIGNNVIIHPGAIIGSDGFGNYQDQNKIWTKIPHKGGVIIEENVEIGANTCIDKGTLGNTLIKKGCKLDNLIHIAHNCIIEENCALAAQVGLTGKTHIKKNTMIGGQVGIDNTVIGENCIIAGKSGVTQSIKDNEIAGGYPAWPLKKELKKEAFIRFLLEKKDKIRYLLK